MCFVASKHPTCIGGGTILHHVIVQVVQPPLEEVEGRSLGIVMLQVTDLAHLRQKLAGNLALGLLLQVFGACGHVLPSFLDSLSSGVIRGVQRALHWLGESGKW